MKITAQSQPNHRPTARQRSPPSTRKWDNCFTRDLQTRFVSKLTALCAGLFFVFFVVVLQAHQRPQAIMDAASQEAGQSDHKLRRG